MERSPHNRTPPITPAALRGASNRSALLLAVLLLLPTTGPAAAPLQRIVCLANGPHPTYAHTLEAFKAVSGSAAVATHVDIRGLIDDSAFADTDHTLFVTFGKEATEHALDRCSKCNVFALATPKDDLDALSRAPDSTDRLSGIYREQPLERQLRVVRSTLPTLNTLGVLLRPEQESMHASIRRIAKSSGLQVRIHAFTGEVKPSAAIQNLAMESNAVLATPDAAIYNKDTMFGILLTSFKSGVPIVGYASEHHDAGALLSIYSTPEDMGKDLADLVSESERTGARYSPVIRFSKYYHVTTNEHVAKSLGIEIEKQQ